MTHSKLGIESSVVAITGACILLLIGKQDPHEIIYSVEWPTIAFFAGLFIVVGGLSNTGVISMLAKLLQSLNAYFPMLVTPFAITTFFTLSVFWVAGLTSEL